MRAPVCFLDLESTASTAWTAEGRGSAHSLEIGMTLVRLSNDKIMMSLATDLVQQFYTYSARQKSWPVTYKLYEHDRKKPKK